MNPWIITTLVLAVMVVVLVFRTYKQSADNALLKKQEERAWTLKVALEKTFELPTVEAKELAAIEPQIDRIMGGSGSDEELEDKVRLAVMELYAKKAERGGKKG
jgi:hypothetical protein